ncbi:hypothetical protein [Lignipirellula cremea]|uniref:Uncharacterized protein n=1 Tax=Lignipirellula cremea TaxID=2528010 RepID=A0A518E4P3_9BACT|nr:hypothetical protein [Lignipirellula cremea]QDU99052.1 hypothetical protein Pla8534_69630 [Lignipirellula cremea]
MFHKAKLDEYAGAFPHDTTGHVPTETDSWRQMKFDHADQDPNEPGISPEEKERRLAYLDNEWWPSVLKSVHEEKSRLEQEHGESFMHHWHNLVNQAPPAPHGFQAEPWTEKDE